MPGECPVLLTQSHFLLIWFGFLILKVSLQRCMIATKVANWTCWPGFWHSPIYHACILAVLGGCFKISEINPVDFGFPWWFPWEKPMAPRVGRSLQPRRRTRCDQLQQLAGRTVAQSLELGEGHGSVTWRPEQRWWVYREKWWFKNEQLAF